MGLVIASQPTDARDREARNTTSASPRFWFLSIGVAGLVIALAWLANPLVWLIVAILLALIVWQAHAVRRLWHWLQRGLGRPPELPAPWDEIAAIAFRRTRDSRSRIRDLIRRMRRDARFAEALPDALVVIDAQRRIEWLSRRATEYLGLSSRDLGKSLTALVRHPDLVAILEDRTSAELVEITLPLSERVLEIRVTELDDTHQLITARDTTQLQRLLTMRQEFVANVSHELRTPLTVIMGYLDQIDDESIETSELRQIVRRLVSPADRMKNLVEDLLLLTRLESSNVPAPEQLAVVDVAAMLRPMANEVRQLGHNKHQFVLQLESSLCLLGVERELYSAFNNLLVNAVRYSPDGGQIAVRWSTTPRGARFDVQDHGVGIAAEHLVRITERFYRIDAARSRASGGTGLGLAIVKHVLRRHGAELCVASTVDSGSTFSCEFDQAHIWRADAGGTAHPQ